jgi:hypothetical protein
MEQRRNLQYAQIIDYFHFTPQQISEMTTRQIHDLLFHYRDNKSGKICIQPEDLNDPTKELMELQKHLRLKPEDLNKLLNSVKPK